MDSIDAEIRRTLQDCRDWLGKRDDMKVREWWGLVLHCLILLLGFYAEWRQAQKPPSGYGGGF